MDSLLHKYLWQLTGEEFITLSKMAQPEASAESNEAESATTRYIYGLRGIRTLFGVSHATAQRLKDGILKPAVKQCGRKIIVDANLAMELFSRK